MVLKVCILDDEVLAVAALRADLERHFSETLTIETFLSPLDALTYLALNTIDILFLDIDMPQINGLEFIEKLGNFNYDIIFTTAYSEYALAAFKLKATDYLLKPVSISELKSTINSVIEKRKRLSSDSKPTKFALVDSTGIEFIPLQNIMYLIADKNYTTFFLNNGSKKVTSKNIGEFEKQLDKDIFIRIHQSSIVNFNYILKLTKGENATVIMEDQQHLNVSRAKKSELLKALQKLI